MKPAPKFSLPDQFGTIHSLSEYAGRWLVVYFYPKDDTPGCTTEACNFRDAREAIYEFGNAEVVGISKDTPRSHAKFANKYNLNFTLLSDPTHVVIDAFGAWRAKKFLGKEFLGTLRNTYIINPDGFIVKEYLGVDPKKYAAEIISDLRSFQSAQ